MSQITPATADAADGNGIGLEELTIAHEGFELPASSSDPEWKYVNVRRYFTYVEDSLDEGTEWTLFQPDGTPLRAETDVKLEDAAASDAVYGLDPETGELIFGDGVQGRVPSHSPEWTSPVEGDPGAETVARWNFENAWPSKVSGPTPKSDGADHFEFVGAGDDNAGLETDGLVGPNTAPPIVPVQDDPEAPFDPGTIIYAETAPIDLFG